MAQPPEIMRLSFCRECGQVDLYPGHCSRCGYSYSAEDEITYTRVPLQCARLLKDAELRIAVLEEELRRSNLLVDINTKHAKDLQGLIREAHKDAAATVHQALELAQKFGDRLVAEARKETVAAFRYAAERAIKDVKSADWPGSFYKPYFVRAVQSVEIDTQ